MVPVCTRNPRSSSPSRPARTLRKIWARSCRPPAHAAAAADPHPPPSPIQRCSGFRLPRGPGTSIHGSSADAQAGRRSGFPLPRAPESPSTAARATPQVGGRSGFPLPRAPASPSTAARATPQAGGRSGFPFPRAPGISIHRSAGDAASKRTRGKRACSRCPRTAHGECIRPMVTTRTPLRSL
ncbi:hypothetical protein BS78_K156900 [Paspalum vaginatum]|uniref:Uncharacterized protein n=1 Tax=Paspalum vaginatum TaxID=158149 RepID=A0A9W7XCJ8_9POAL|nr:hypothetical protein BS78_K156900 [Paspalum vaginatum]